MNRIDRHFRDARDHGPLVMPFITAGFPDLDVTEQVVRGCADAGIRIMEIGVPFSDPIADGPVIAASMHDALQRGTTPRAVLDRLAAIRPDIDLGLVLMLSHSIVARLGGAAFVHQAADAGIDGLIVPDIDLHAADALLPAVDDRDLAFALLVAPTTSPTRLEQICARCRGFVYLLARAGITGERDDAPDIAASAAAVRAVTSLPVAAGFGISRPEHVRAATRHADAAIVGSAIVRTMRDAADPTAAALDLIATLTEDAAAR